MYLLCSMHMFTARGNRQVTDDIHKELIDCERLSIGDDRGTNGGGGMEL